MGDLEDIQFHDEKLDGVEWENDELFFTHTYSDETSEFDDHPSRRWTGQCFDRDYRVRVPVAFKDCDDLIERFLEMMIDNYPGIQGFFLD